jgi:hypothetical protein
MKEQNLINCGFKRIADDNEYWYEIRVKGGHRFLTNDTLWNDRKDNWIIGYDFKNGDTFWFNNKLHEEGLFKIIFHLLVGKDFKLAHQRKLIIH